MLNNILTNKKKLIYILIAILLVIAIAIGVVFALKAINNNTSNKTPDATTTITKATADTLKTQAIEALKNNDNTKAKTLLTQAKQQYEDLGDTNNVIDTDAQLYMIEHPGTPK
jgi:uncharacterized protein HemX